MKGVGCPHPCLDLGTLLGTLVGAHIVVVVGIVAGNVVDAVVAIVVVLALALLHHHRESKGGPSRRPSCSRRR